MKIAIATEEATINTTAMRRRMRPGHGLDSILQTLRLWGKFPGEPCGYIETSKRLKASMIPSWLSLLKQTTNSGILTQLIERKKIVVKEKDFFFFREPRH